MGVKYFVYVRCKAERQEKIVHYTRLKKCKNQLEQEDELMRNIILDSLLLYLDERH